MDLCIEAFGFGVGDPIHAFQQQEIISNCIESFIGDQQVDVEADGGHRPLRMPSRSSPRRPG